MLDCLSFINYIVGIKTTPVFIKKHQCQAKEDTIYILIAILIYGSSSVWLFVTLTQFFIHIFGLWFFFFLDFIFPFWPGVSAHFHFIFIYFMGKFTCCKAFKNLKKGLNTCFICIFVRNTLIEALSINFCRLFISFVE